MRYLFFSNGFLVQNYRNEQSSLCVTSHILIPPIKHMYIIQRILQNVIQYYIKSFNFLG